MSSAELSVVNNRHKLTLTGESDNGATSFELVVASDQPLTTGTYTNGQFDSNRLESFSFTSLKKQWNGNTTYFYSDYRRLMSVRIDDIDARHVKGVITGMLYIQLAPGATSGAVIDNGSFSMSF